MRRVTLVALLLTAIGCAPRKPSTPDPHAADRAQLADADALVLAGCFDCLLEANRTYEALRGSPDVADAAAAGVARTDALLAIRERELGTDDSGYLARAREVVSAAPALQHDLNPLLEIVDTLPGRGGGQRLGDDIELARTQAAFRNRAAWTEHLDAHKNDNPLAAYVWLAYSCAYVPSSRQDVDARVAELTTLHDAPLMAFTAATCSGYLVPPIERLLQADSRFVELNYYLGLASIFAGRLDPAIERLQRAYAWRSRWPAVTTSLANANMTLEEFDKAIDFFDRTLAVVPQQPDALLGKMKALTFSGKYAESIGVADQLLALEHWYVGDARYWRALDEAQLGQNDAAWDDVELAAKLLVNAEVPKLAGIIAYRRKQLDVSRAKFDESRDRNRDDCETGFYLGVVLAEQTAWPRTADVLIDTIACLAKAETTLNEEIARIRAGSDPEERKARQITRREQRIAEGRRMRATSSFNIAVASYNLGRQDIAREYAAKVVDDEQFGARARELLDRMR